MSRTIESTLDRRKLSWRLAVLSGYTALFGICTGLAVLAPLTSLSAVVGVLFIVALGTWLSGIRGWLRGQSRQLVIDNEAQHVIFRNLVLAKSLWRRRTEPILQCPFSDIIAVYPVYGAFRSIWFISVGISGLAVVTKHGTVHIPAEMNNLETVEAVLQQAVGDRKDTTIHGRTWLYALIMLAIAGIAIGLLLWAGVLD